MDQIPGLVVIFIYKSRLARDAVKLLARINLVELDYRLQLTLRDHRLQVLRENVCCHYNVADNESEKERVCEEQSYIAQPSRHLLF